MPDLRNLADQLQRIIDFGRIEPGVHLVEEQNLGLHGKALGKLQALAARQGERLGRLVEKIANANLLRQFPCALDALPPAIRAPPANSAPAAMLSPTLIRGNGWTI